MEKISNIENPNLCGCRTIHLERVEKAWADAIDDGTLSRLAVTFKILGDPTRLKIVMALSGGEMCVCDLAAYLKLTESGTSHQLRRLKDLALVKNRRQGKILFYSLDDEHVGALLDIGLDHAREQGCR